MGVECKPTSWPPDRLNPTKIAVTRDAMAFGDGLARGGEKFAIGKRETRKNHGLEGSQNRSSPVDNNSLYLTYPHTRRTLG
jgi:hypothetical protein